jgi:hypothetical protein
MPVEIERLGTQELLKSRGAKVLPFSGFDVDFEQPAAAAIDSSADVIVVAGGTVGALPTLLLQLIDSVGQTAPKWVL